MLTTKLKALFGADPDPELITELRELLREPVAPVDTRTPAEIRAEAERLEAERIQAERDERCRTDPVVQAGYARERERLEREHQAEIAKFRGWVSTDTAAFADAHRREFPNIISRIRCCECRLETYDAVRPGTAVKFWCKSCMGRHKLHCDQCGKGKDVVTSYFLVDDRWRCESCSAAFTEAFNADPERHKPKPGPALIFGRG